jgi:hypothetical protein
MKMNLKFLFLSLGTGAGEVVGEKLDVERRQLGIYTDAEMMSAKREVEEKAVWKQEQQEALESEQQKQQELTTTKILQMMRAKQQVAEVSLDVGGLDVSDSNTVSQDLYADFRSGASAQVKAKVVANVNSNKQPFLSSPTSTGDTNGKWQQNVNVQSQQSASAKMLSAINAQTSVAGTGGYNQFENADWFEKTVVFGTEAVVGKAIGSVLGVDAAIGWGIGGVARRVVGGLERFGTFGGSKTIMAMEDSPATNIPGSFARYEKQIDATGSFYKNYLWK